MRNGFNISNVSEFVHEIRTVREEALIRLSAAATSSAGQELAAVRTGTLRGGTIRVARDFAFECDSPWRARHVAPLPWEYAVAALGGCVLVTYIQGASARGITVTNLQVAVDAERVVTNELARPLQKVAYVIRIDCDADPEQLMGVARHVSCLSPNHRTFIDPNSISVNLYRKGTGGLLTEQVLGIPTGNEVLVAPQGVEKVQQLHAEVTWDYGAHMTATCSIDGSVAERAVFGIDQPKQYMGLDKAPNPQEYLLSSLAAELSNELRAAARREDISIGDLELSCAGSIDLQGITYVNPEAPVKLHDVVLDVQIESSAPLEALQKLVQRACSRATLQSTVCQPGVVQVRLEHKGEQVLAFTSERAQVHEYLQTIANAARQASAAQAAASAGVVK